MSDRQSMQLTVVTVYAMIGMVAAVVFTFTMPLIAAVFFGSQWICPVALLGVVMFFAALIIGALSMKVD